MQTLSWVSFFTVIGAFAAYLFNRGTRLKRARMAALEDLQLHEKASALFGSDDPMVDQVRAQARASVKTYNARRAAEVMRPVAWVSRLTVLISAVVLGALAVGLGVDEPMSLLALGAVGGVIGICVETGTERLLIRRPLRKIPVKREGDTAEASND